MTNVSEITRTRQINDRWAVEVLSAVTGQWIIQGVWATKAQAEADRRNWM